MSRVMVRLSLMVGVSVAVWAATPREELVALRAQLASQKALGRTSGWAAELKFAETQGKKEPALAAEVIYEVALSQRQREASAVPKTLALLLEKHPKVEPWAALATYELAAGYAESSSTVKEAIQFYEQFLKFASPDPVRRANALLSLGRLYKSASKPDKAMVSFRAFLDQFADHTKGCAEALGSIGLILVEQKQPKDAHGVYTRLSAAYPWELEQRYALLLAIAQAFRTSEAREEAIAVYEELLENLPRGDPRRAQVYTGLAMLYIQEKHTEKAAAIYRRMATDRAINDYIRNSAYRQLFDLHRGANDPKAIIRLAHELIAAQPSRALEAGNVLDELVDALISEGRIDEAIAMARAYYRLSRLTQPSSASSSSSSSHKHRATLTQGAIFAVVRALKAKEASLRSANEFIAYVEQGPEGPDAKLGTPDDTKDPTAGCRLPADAERDKIFSAAAKHFMTDPHELGHLYICWDKPDDALRAFRCYYLTRGEAPSRPGSSSSRRATSGLQSAADLLARAMRALGRSEAEVDAFFEFQNYGPNGKDGKPKTNDDLKDPLAAKK